MDRPTLPPHVLIFPFPVQGHVNSMLKLADLLLLAGLHVTFLVTDFTHRRLLRYTNIQSRFYRYPGFQLKTISDGLPEEHSRSGHRFMEIYDSLKATTPPLLKQLLVSDGLTTNNRRPVTCIIADGILGLVLDVGKDIGIPVIYFRTISACAFWAYFCIPQLIEAGELPFSEITEEDLDLSVTSVPGMEGFLRRRDLPSFCRVTVDDLAKTDFQMVIRETRQTPQAHALILNTFEDLEGSILSEIRTQCPKLYNIGPLHAHLKTRLAAENTTPTTSSNSLREEDRSCISWLDAQPLMSVLYVSFGSIAIMTREQVMEFWHGLVSSGKRYLWVIRPDSLAGEDGLDQIPAEILEGTKDRGCIVGWAPQEEVLAHIAVGGFWTHSGWNSTLESICVGVPMICWPYFADQQVNSRFVGEVWKLGMDMKDTCDRVLVEKMIKDLMEVRREELVGPTEQMAKLARKSVSEGGSSYCNLDRLIEDIRLMSEPA